MADEDVIVQGAIVELAVRSKRVNVKLKNLPDNHYYQLPLGTEEEFNPTKKALLAFLLMANANRDPVKLIVEPIDSSPGIKVYQIKEAYTLHT